MPAGSDGAATVTIAGAADSAGNPNAAASNNSFTIDNTSPTLALTYSPDRDVRDEDTLVVTATFNEAVTGTPTIAVDVAGTADLSATSMTDSGDQTTFTFSYDVPAGSDGAATVTIAGAADSAGNPNAAASNNSFTIDNSAPTVALSYSKHPVRDADTLVVTATFNEAVTGTPTIAIDVAGTADLSATSMTDSGDQTTFTFSYDVPAGSDGAATVTIAGAADAAGNPNAAASNDSFTIDNTAPTVALSYSKDPVRDADTLVVTATFNEAVTCTPTIAIDVAGTADLPATSMTDSGNQTTFTFSYDVPAGSDGSATVTISGATDSAGNPNDAASNDSFTIDNTAPTVDLTYSPDRDVRDEDTLVITATFNEAVSGTPTITIDTTGSDLPATSMTDSGDQTTFTFSYDVPTASDGSATVTIAGATDAAGNPNASASNNTFTIDATANLWLTKEAAPGPVLLGQQLTYTLILSNKGPSTGADVTLTDVLPPELDFVSASPGCVESAGSVTCSIGILASGDSSTITILVVPNSIGDVTNSATTFGSVADPDTGDNTASTTTTTVVSAANLWLTKESVPDPVLLGQQLTYTLTVSNKGPSTSADVTLTDVLPTEVSLISLTSDQGTCIGINTIICDLGTLTCEDVATVSIVVRADATGDLTNVATVAGSVADPDTGDNTASVTTTVVAAADLSLTKTDSPDPVLLGQQLTYTLTVTNNGPSLATDVTKTDTLPAAVSFVSASSACEEFEGTVTCIIATIASGDVGTVSIVVSPGSIGTITNTSTVTSNVPDSDTGDNSATVTTLVDAAADLSVTKTDTPDPVLLGEQLTYTIMVTNEGPSAATSAIATITLPAEVTFVSSEPSQGSCSGTGTLTCNMGTIADGTSASVNIVMLPNTTGELTSTVVVDSSVADPNPLDNSATVTTLVNAEADLSVTKTGSPDPVLLGEQLTYILTVSNSGPSPGTSVTLTDTLPAEADFVSSSFSLGSCSGTSTITCALGTIESGDSATVTIVVSPNSTGELINTATVDSSVADPDPLDNSATETTLVNAEADLSVTKTGSPDPVLSGEQLTYTLIVSNSGPSPGTSVTLTDTLPAEVDFVSSNSSQGSCSGTSPITCALGTVQSGDSATVTIVVSPNSPGELINTTTVDSSVADPDPSNNTATATTTVDALALPPDEVGADLSLIKVASADPVLLGSQLTYTLTVTNAGPSTGADAVLTDTLPGSVTFVSASDGCGEAQGTVTCTLGTIETGDTATVSIVVTPNSTGDLTNTATVTSSVADPDPSNNTATVTTTVDTLALPPGEVGADLSLIKLASADPVLLGSQITYTLTVTNVGPSTGADVVLTDTLPVSVTFVSASDGCGEAQGIVTCTLGTIETGDSATVSIVVTPNSTGDLTNTATVTSSVEGPNIDNNSATANTTVGSLANLSLTKADSPDPVFLGTELTYTLTVTNGGPSPLPV